MIGQKLTAAADQMKYLILQLPDVPFRSSAVRGGIHDDPVVTAASADLTFHEFQAVVGEPSDRSIGKTGRSGIFFCPAHNAFGGIYRGDCAAAEIVAPPV